MINPSKPGFEKSDSIPHTRISSQAQIENNYDIGEKIGQGSFGIVYAVTEKSTGTKWAMKCLAKVEKSLAIQLLEREVAILKKVQHENIIQLKEVFETHDKVFLIMEYCGGGELADELLKVKKYSELEVKKIMSSLASAIAYLHKSDIVHRDLKLSNILLSDNPSDDEDHLFIKVTDFGLSVIKGGVGHENMMNSFCGTLIYMAPEVLENKTYSQQCDVWAMGIIAYQLLCGIPPFMSEDEDTLMGLIRSGEFEFSSDWDDISSDAKNCIQNMLHLDTGYRLTAAEVLQHSWFTGMKQDDQPTSGNILELMSNWKDDLIKDHLKEDIDNQTESDESDKEAEQDKTENASAESNVRKQDLPERSKTAKTKSSTKDPQEVPEKPPSLPTSGTSRLSPDKAFINKSLLGRPTRSVQSKQTPETKRNTSPLSGQNPMQMKSSKKL